MLLKIENFQTLKKFDALVKQSAYIIDILQKYKLDLCYGNEQIKPRKQLKFLFGNAFPI